MPTPHAWMPIRHVPTPIRPDCRRRSGSCRRQCARADAEAVRAEAARRSHWIGEGNCHRKNAARIGACGGGAPQADIAALREELKASMNTQAKQVARAQREAEMYAARLAAHRNRAGRGTAARDQRSRERTAWRRPVSAWRDNSRASRSRGGHRHSAGELGPQLETAIATADGQAAGHRDGRRARVRRSSDVEVVQQALVALATNRAQSCRRPDCHRARSGRYRRGRVSKPRRNPRRRDMCSSRCTCWPATPSVGLAPELFECTDPAVWALAGIEPVHRVRVDAAGARLDMACA